MAFDGIVISNIVHELNTLVSGGRIGKVAQPEKDELILTLRNNRTNYKLLLSSMASMPKLHLTTINKVNPITAPNFCMLLRKHLVGGKIISITQPNFERIVVFNIENLDELGELVTRKLIIEIMGRHSNIILTDQDNLILDAIRRVGAQISSVREVFPNRTYVYPPNQDKVDPLTLTSEAAFIETIKKGFIIQKSLYQNITGLSPIVAQQLCYLSGIDGDLPIEDLDAKMFSTLYVAYEKLVATLVDKTYEPTLYSDDKDTPKAFSSVPLTLYKDYVAKPYESASEMIEDYYQLSAVQSRISQKSVDLRKLVHTNLERCYKKLNIQLQQIKDTEDREKFKIIGELINANIYQIKEGDSEVTVLDYYNDNAPRIIKLDVQLNPSQNSQKQYNKYNKKKRTLAALTRHIVTTQAEITHLESVQFALLTALKEEDLLEVREELMETGYLKFKRSKKKKALSKASPMHFISSDGFNMYVGKNNIQNDTLSTKFANGGDWWFHAKGIPGAHVIVQSKGLTMEELPDRLYEEAAALAAYYSKDKGSPKVSVDYIQKKYIKKPNTAAPGFVVYKTNYSMMVAPNIDGITMIDN